MNPEFRRQLWLHFSLNRLALMPALLLTCAGALFLSANERPYESLAVASAVAFTLLVWGMGTRAAGASVIDEMNEHTWDQQRMSAMQPWAMTWGKLAGATAYAWYGGAICLLVAVPCALLGGYGRLVGPVALGAALAGVFLQAVLLAVNLQLAKVGGRMARRGGAWLLLLMLLWGSGPLSSVLSDPQSEVHWWRFTVASLDFAVASLAMLAACALVAAWRCMAEVLAVRQWPWGWPALALVATGYLAGFFGQGAGPVVGVVGLGVCAGMTYFALFSEPQPRPLWQRVLVRASAGQWGAALRQLPRWPTTWLLALPFALCTVWTMDELAQWPHAAAQYRHIPWVVVLLMVRDCSLALFFAFSPRGRRPVLALCVTLFVLYALLPWLMALTDHLVLLGIVLPPTAQGLWSVGAALGHAASAVGLLFWRWRRHPS